MITEEHGEGSMEGTVEARCPIGVFDLFTVGIGPSSSHTVGPMRAARRFAQQLIADRLLEQTAGFSVDVYGSLAATGAGHGTFTALLLGLEGYDPASILPIEMEQRLESISSTGVVRLCSAFGHRRDLEFRAEDIGTHPSTVLERHPNGMRFRALDTIGAVLSEQIWFSIGGGFIVRDSGESGGETPQCYTTAALPYQFRTAAQLLEHCRRTGLRIADVMLANELTRRNENEVRTGLLQIWNVMQQCKESGISRSGNLPGSLRVARRAPEWYRKLDLEDPHREPIFWQEWVNLVALAVNEENASGGRVVTAPTNGAAGIIPAVLYYATHYSPTVRRAMVDAPETVAVLREQIVVRFLLAAAAVGVLYKEQASISGAEVGCQGEVGSAASMAAAGLAEIMNGTPEQVENAAEIAMEHNLGLTCDPIGGLVQIPCIERNAIAAAKAINATKMALRGDGTHRVSLDEVIAAMRETGRDMSHKYKETALGGLAVNVVEC